MNLHTFAIILGLSVLPTVSLFSNCSGCARGESILNELTSSALAGGIGAGASGGAGVGAGPFFYSGYYVLDHLYNFNTVAVPAEAFPTGSAITFNGTPLTAGTAITQPSSSTFTFAKQAII